MKRDLNNSHRKGNPSSKKITRNLPAVLLTVGLALATGLFLLFGLIIPSTAGKSRIPCIALPADNGFIEAWTPHLPQLAQSIGIPELSIKTYSSFPELEKLFKSADKINLLWAEVPLSNRYPVTKLHGQGLLSEVTLDAAVSQSYPQSIITLANQTVSGTTNSGWVIPLSFNPWFRLSKLRPETDTCDFETAAPGSTTHLLLGTFTLFRAQLSTDTQIASITDTLDELLRMSNDTSLQRNVKTYTFKDALNLLLENKARTLVLSAAHLPEIPNDYLLGTGILPLGNTLTADITYAVFPARSAKESRKAVTRSQKALLIPDILFATANSRNYLPAYIGTPTKNSFTDFVRKQARQSKACLVPDLQFMDEGDYVILVSRIKETLSSSYTE